MISVDLIKRKPTSKAWENERKGDGEKKVDRASLSRQNAETSNSQLFLIFFTESFSVLFLKDTRMGYHLLKLLRKVG